MTKLLDGREPAKMTTDEMRTAGEDAASTARYFGGHGLDTMAHNAIVDLALLLDEALGRINEAAP